MYRLYIDETGNADLEASRDPNHRYLSLTGIIMGVDYARHTTFPRLEDIKASIFGSHPDDPIILHRKDIIAKKWPFHALRNAEVESMFNVAMLSFLEEIDYTVVTVVIDKLAHLTRYIRWRQDPYHYCMEVLVERFVMWLEEHNAMGDVLAEVRGGRPDRRLEKSFAWLYQHGTFHIRAETLQKRLASKHLKLKPKTANVAGLQMADMIAHPSSLYVRWMNNAGDPPDKFGGKIVDILTASKYRRSRHLHPVLRGYGVKWLP